MRAHTALPYCRRHSLPKMGRRVAQGGRTLCVWLRVLGGGEREAGGDTGGQWRLGLTMVANAHHPWHRARHWLNEVHKGLPQEAPAPVVCVCVC